MRLSQTLCRIVMPALILVVLAGCRSKNPADNPTVLGSPPATAYLGVDYYYDFGSYGGSNIPKYTLSNAPSWMALEQTTNKARPGIVLHGVPGITGGHRGTADLGKTDGIAITTTDGSASGSNAFSVQVEPNKISTSSIDVTEGEASSAGSITAGNAVCDKGDMSQTGTLTASNVPIFDSQNQVTGTTTKTYTTYPVLIPVTLSAPSVEPITIAWNLSSRYDPTCPLLPASPTFEHDCEFSSSNRASADLGKDVVGSTGTLKSTPSYLQYTGSNQGLLTIPAGKSTCFIRVEVAADDLPEDTETFQVDLTDVRSGLADLGSRGEQTANVNIHDSQPTVSFSQASDAITLGQQAQYTATLSKVPSVATTVPLTAVSPSTASAGDYQFWVGGQETNNLVFAPGEASKDFTVKIVQGSATQNPFTDDLQLDVGADANQAYGHDNFAYAGGARIAIEINEWIKRLVVGQTSGFVPNSMAVGDHGQVFLAGTEAGKVALKALDRFSNDVTSAEIPSTAFDGTGTQADPQISYNQRKITLSSQSYGTTTIERRELAVGYDTDGTVAGQQSQGNRDVGLVVLRRQDQATQYRQQWTDQLGSPGDDLTRGIAFDSSGNVYVGGVTNGVWPKGALAGGYDIFAARIDNNNATLPDGSVSEVDSVPELNWEREWGSPLDEKVDSVLTVGTKLYVGGTTTGSLEASNHVFGGVDGYFSGVEDQTSPIQSFQFGTQYDDNVMAMAPSGRDLFVTGGSVADYQKGSSVDILKDGVRLNSENPFLLQLTSGGSITSALTLQDQGDTSADYFDTLLVNGPDVYLGGQTAGSFKDGVSATGQDLILARVQSKFDSSSRSQVLTDIWRVQQDDGADEKVMRLGQYGANKLIALVRTGSDQTGTYQYEIRLYKLQDGTELTSK